MKKGFLLFTVGLTCLFSCLGAKASNQEIEKNQYGNEVRRGKMAISRYLCSEDMNFSPEKKKISKSGEVFYVKNVDIKKGFQKLCNSEFEPQGKIDLNVTFTYDKKSYVGVQKSDVKSSKDCKSWKVRNASEIFPSKNACLVSDRYAIYQKSAMGGIGDYLFDGHMDVICSINGEIFVNTEIS